jgi:hypothetical protein
MLDTLRAILVLCHLLAITLVAFPSVKGLRPVHLKHPESQRALGVIASWTGAPIEQVQAQVLQTGDQLNATRRAVLRPLQPYYTYAGTRQTWRMFGVINHKPAQLEIHHRTREDLDWQPLFISNQAAHDWMARQLNHVRLRSFIASFSFRRERWMYTAFVRWLTAQAAADGMDGQLRVQMRPCPIPDPRQLRQSGALPCANPYWVEQRELP